jgi:hypothetical protein
MTDASWHPSVPESLRFRGPRLARSMIDALRTRDPRAGARAGGPLRASGRPRGDWLELLPDGNRPRLVPFLARQVAGLAGEQHLAH